MSLDKKVVLITGASQGIGSVIARKFLENGSIVICTSSSHDKVKLMEDYLIQYGTCHGVKVDITKLEEINKALHWIEENVGSPDILVNNAGINEDNLIIKMSDESWNNVMDTNLTAIFRISRFSVRSMIRKRWGRIINIGSVVGSSGNPGQTNYCASKAGIIGFSKSLAHEVASRNITVNVISPGFIKTDMIKKISEVKKEKIIKMIPLKKLGEPKDIAEMVLFLSSDKARYITGQTIHVNGGLYMA